MSIVVRYYVVHYKLNNKHYTRYFRSKIEKDKFLQNLKQEGITEYKLESKDLFEIA